MILRSILSCKIKLRSMLVILMACMMFIAKKGHADVGKSGWPIFKKAQAANSRGILSTFGDYSSLSGLFYNPALVAGKDQREAYFFSESGMVGDTLGGLMYAHPVKDGVIAGGLVGYDAGSIELNWIENGSLMTQNASAERDLMGTVSYGRRLRNNLYAGASVKAATTQIAERNSANAFAMDFGATYMTPKGIMFSAALQNVGTSTKFIEKENPLPTSTYLGAGYARKIKNAQVLTGVGATYNIVDQKMTPEIGAELRYQMFSMNVGYRFADESVLTLGLGIHVNNNIEVNYAYVPGIYLGTTHRISVGYKFGGSSRNETAAGKGAATAVNMKTTGGSVTAAPAGKAETAVKTTTGTPKAVELTTKTAPAKAATVTTGTTTGTGIAPTTSKSLKAGIQKAASSATKPAATVATPQKSGTPAKAVTTATTQKSGATTKTATTVKKKKTATKQEPETEAKKGTTGTQNIAG